VGVTPLDQGVSPFPPPIAPQTPDQAPGRRRAANSAYDALASKSPRDAGVVGNNYNVYANTGAGDPIDYGTVVFTTTGVTWTSDPLSYPGVWSFGVRAFNAYGEEKNLDCALSIELDGAAVDITRIPTAPYSLRAVPKANGTIRVEWHHVVTNKLKKPTLFNVYYGTSGVDYSTVQAVVDWTGQSLYGVDLTGLTDGASYSFGVRAANATGEEKNTLAVAATADATGPTAVDAFTLDTVALEGS